MDCPRPCPSREMSLIFTGSRGTSLGGAQSRNAGYAQNHLPPIRYRAGATSLHTVTTPAFLITNETGSTKTAVLLYVAGISWVQLLDWRGTTSTSTQVVTYTAPPFLMACSPLPNTLMTESGLSDP